MKEMFEAFRCVKPLGDKPAAQLPAPKPVSAAAAQAGVAKGAKRKRPQPAAAPTGEQLEAASNAAAAAAGGGAKIGGLLEMLGDRPLRLIIVGHKPSDHAWSSGHYYSNPNNWMWRLLKETGIASEALRGAEDDGLMPELAGVGFTDVGTGIPGTQSSAFKSKHCEAWREPFFQRLRSHMQRACAAAGCACGRCGAPALVAFSGKRQFAELFGGGAARPKGAARQRAQQAAAAAAGGSAAAAVPGSAAGASAAAAVPGPPPAGASAAAAVSGTSAAGASAAAAVPGPPLAGASSAAAVPGSAAGAPRNATPPEAGRGVPEAAGPLPDPQPPPQVLSYQRQRPASIETGRQWVLPEGWPLPPSTEVWVMTSTSGAAAMTREQRTAPWRQLSERLQREPWPREGGARCGGSVAGPSP